MAEDTNVTPEAATQSDEARASALSGAPRSSGTATGQAIAQRNGEEAERIDNLESRGSTRPIAGGDAIQPDAAAGGGDPIGLQAEPAIFVSNGTIPPNMVPSSSGLVPTSSVTSDPEEASRRVQENLDKFKEQSRTRPAEQVLSEEEIDSLSGPELRAIGLQRGYDMGQGGGTRTIRARFSTQQAGGQRLRI